MAIPILSGEDVAAVLNVEKDEPGGFDHGQVITLETLADGIGVVLRNAELYQALESTNVKLVELDRMKSELVNIVAHDFRAPLAGVLGHAELLEWRPDAPREDRIEEARSIIHAATHMASLVDKTLKTTRLESGRLPFEFAVFDLAALTRDVVRRVPERSTHPLVLDMADEDPLPCWGDRDRIAEVLDNLISNAVKYSPDGGAVRVEVRRQGDSATLRVVDRGIGIDPDGLRPPVPGVLARPHAAHRGHPGIRPRPLHLRPHRAGARRRPGRREPAGRGIGVLARAALVRGGGPDEAADGPGRRRRRAHPAGAAPGGGGAGVRHPRRDRRGGRGGGRAAPHARGRGPGPGDAAPGRGGSRGEAEG